MPAPSTGTGPTGVGFPTRRVPCATATVHSLSGSIVIVMLTPGCFFGLRAAVFGFGAGSAGCEGGVGTAVSFVAGFGAAFEAGLGVEFEAAGFEAAVSFVAGFGAEFDAAAFGAGAGAGFATGRGAAGAGWVARVFGVAAGRVRRSSSYSKGSSSLTPLGRTVTVRPSIPMTFADVPGSMPKLGIPSMR